jgi:hypothetical protein
MVGFRRIYRDYPGMAETHVVFALKEKRARLAGELDKTQLRVMRLRSDLAAVDQCLKLFKPEIDPTAIKPKVTFGKTSTGLHKGAGTRTALEILRETGQAMSSQELAAAVLQRHGLPLEQDMFLMMVKCIHANFARRPDRIVEFDRSTYPGKWRLRPQSSQRLAIVRAS